MDNFQNIGNEVGFNRALKSFSPDLQMLFNTDTKRMGVYQLKSAHFEVAGAKPWLLFEIVDEYGDPRLPNESDIARAYASTKSAERLWSKGGDWYTDSIEAQEEKRETAREAKLDEQIRFITRDTFNAARTVKTPRNR